MRAPRYRFLLLTGLAVICAVACQKQAPADSQADAQPDQASASPERLHDPQEIAALICKYSRGSFPNWTLWQDFAEYLRPDERDAVQYVSEQLTAQIPPRRRPKHRAVSKFIAAHTTCVPAIEDGMPVISRDEAGVVRFRFSQKYPNIPNVPPPFGIDEMPPTAQETAWLNAFERANTNPVEYERTVFVTVEPDAEHRYHVQSNVQKSYAEPLRARAFQQKMELWRFEEAFEHLTVMCVQSHPACAEFKAYYASTAAFRREKSARFARDVTVTQVRQTLVAPGAGGSYTAIELTLTNRGDQGFYGIVFATDEAERQYCELQSERTHRGDRPLTLGPGETRQAWCALRSDTGPWVATEFWISG